MRRRVFLVGTATFLLAMVATWQAARSSEPAPITTITIFDSQEQTSGDIAGLLHRGRDLELQHRWGEALSLYEDAIRQHRAEPTLQQRFDYARLHYDLQRRYNDRSYCDTVARLPLERALELYSQVLLKIDSHYVEAPQWKDLVSRGNENLEVALSESVFLERNVAEAVRPALGAFRHELRGAVSPQNVRSRYDASNAVAAAARLAQQRLGIAPSAVIMEYLCGATNALDPYSAYLTPAQFNEVYSQIEGNFVGLGVELKAVDGALTIVHVITGSPAEEAGIRSGDQILAVGGQPTNNLATDQAAHLLEGTENTTVALTIATAGQTPRQVVVRRRRVDVPSVDQVAIIDAEHGVGYFKLTCFQKTTARDLDAALWKLHREGMKSLVIDMCNNPGGVLDASVEVADRFIDRGVIVSQRSRIAQEDFTYSAHEQGKWRMPLVVMLDENSASAAEILAMAIHDHQRGVLVGTRSFGKGYSQGIFPLDGTNSGIRLTTAKLYSPKGYCWSHVGIEPDVLVRQEAASKSVRVAAKPVDGRLPAEANPILTAAVREAVRLTGTDAQAVQQARK
jgi:carboxyl-terminal processing protease